MQPTALDSDTRNGVLGEIDVYSRRDFLDIVWRYGSGQHVTMLGPTQRGKTTLCLQLLQRSISPEHRCVILASKPPGRDGTMGRAAEMLNLRVVKEWPPVKTYKDRNRNGYVLQPEQHMKDIPADHANIRKQFKKAMLANFAQTKNPVITVCDEAYFVQNTLKLKDEYEAPLMRGAPHNAEWSLIQRGRWMSYLAYSMPEHIFIYYDPDRSNRQRYSEIGGVDPKYIEAIIENLQTKEVKNGSTTCTISEALYIRRSGFMCIVGMS